MVPRCVIGVLGGMRLVPVGEVGMMGGCLMIASVMVLRGFGVMMGGHSVMVGGLTVMMRCLF